MSQYISPVESNLTLCLCEAFDCNSKATAQVQVNAGKFGNITLNVCKDCVSKFEEGDLK